ncbi:MAG: hypothetical protein ACQEXO_16045 [Pseudomonadota bacterium]
MNGGYSVPFLWVCDLQLFIECLPQHPNDMSLIAHGVDRDRQQVPCIKRKAIEC